MIPFVVGPRSPSGLQAQLQAEESLQEQMANAPRALGPLIAINISTVLNRSKEIKALFAEDFMDIDDRVMENYSLLLSMGVEVSGPHQKFQIIASKLCLLKSELLFKKGLSTTCCRDGRSFTNKSKGRLYQSCYIGAKKKPPKGKVGSSKLQETQFDYFLLQKTQIEK